MGLNESNDFIARRYDRLAPVFPLVELAFFMPRTLRRKTVAALALQQGDRVLEVGCGSGRNLPLLARAVGASGRVIATDISEGMLRRAAQLAERRDMTNVKLLHEDAAQLALSDPVDAVLFSLSYSVMPNRHEALARAWAALKPAGTLVIMDAGSFGRLGRALHAAGRLLSKATVLGDPAIRPWEELGAHRSEVLTEFFLSGTYVICRSTTPADPTQTVDAP